MLAQSYKFINHLYCSNNLVVIFIDRSLQHFHQAFSLNKIALHTCFYFIIQQLSQNFQSYILMFHTFQFHKKLFGEYGYIRLLYTCRIKDINDLFRYQGFINHLTNGSLYFLICFMGR